MMTANKLKTLLNSGLRGAQNSPRFAAETNGFFAKRALAAETCFTARSNEQRDGLAQRKSDVAHRAIRHA